MTDTPEETYHYGVVRRALDIIDAQGAGIRLEDLSRELGMSPAHLQRVFSQWAGLSPKRYGQYLALDHAKTLLRARHTTLETAATIGLSGSGRLHDLFVRWEAMAPGDYAAGGAGLTIFWGWFESPFGPTLVMGTDRGICGMGFGAETGAEPTFADLKSRWPKATFVEDPMRSGPLGRCGLWQGRGRDSALVPDRRAIPDQSVGSPTQNPLGTRHNLFRNRAGYRQPQGRARGRDRSRPEPYFMADSLPSRPAQIGRFGRLPLGPARQTRDACV